VSVAIVVSARMASSRYPGKAVVPLGGRPLLGVLLERLREAQGVDTLGLATTRRPEDDALCEIASCLELPVYRGEEDDVLKRTLGAAEAFGAHHVVRVTGDNPLTDVGTLEGLVSHHLASGADYTYVPGEALLMGILSEVIRVEALQRSWDQGGASHRSELVTLYIKEHPEEFRIETRELDPALNHPELRLTVDEAEDVALMQALFERLGSRCVTTREAIGLLLRDPALASMNAHLRHKAANLRSVALDAAIQGRVS
jgi:spore coat polysaccharide biosynthesis protein SpsF